MWWHGWRRESFQELGSALMIGHIIECSTYATGGYYSGFKDLGVDDTDMGCEYNSSGRLQHVNVANRCRPHRCDRPHG